MRVCDMPEYKELVAAIMVAKKFDQEQAEFSLDDAMSNIEDGHDSYASVAMSLGLHVNLVGQCGFDAADYLSRMV